MTRFFASAAVASVAILGATFAAGISASAQASESGRSQLEQGLGGTLSTDQSLTLSQLGAAEDDRSSDERNQQMIIHPGVVFPTPGSETASSIPPRLDEQLIVGAGLTPAEAKDMTLSQIAAKKFTRDNSE